MRKVFAIAYLVIILVFVILITLILIVLVVLVLELILVEVIKTVLELQRLAGEPIDGAWDELLFDVFSKLVVKLELGFDLLVDLLFVILWWRSRVEEVKERWRWNSLLDDAGLLRVCGCQ